MNTLVCLLEEESAKVMLQAILPKFIPETVTVRYSVFEGKQDLERRLVKKLKHWITDNTVFLILRDQDAGNCVEIKNGLREKVDESGKAASTCIRIACRELESYFLGDLAAVEVGLSVKNIAKNQRKKKYRNPDLLANPAKELTKLFPTYNKVAGARAIAPHLVLNGNNKSKSFNSLVNGIKALIQ